MEVKKRIQSEMQAIDGDPLPNIHYVERVFLSKHLQIVAMNEIWLVFTRTQILVIDSFGGPIEAVSNGNNGRSYVNYYYTSIDWSQITNSSQK